jgi:hypothetical protein
MSGFWDSLTAAGKLGITFAFMAVLLGAVFLAYGGRDGSQPRIAEVLSTVQTQVVASTATQTAAAQAQATLAPNPPASPAPPPDTPLPTQAPALTDPPAIIEAPVRVAATVVLALPTSTSLPTATPKPGCQVEASVSRSIAGDTVNGRLVCDGIGIGGIAMTVQFVYGSAAVSCATVSNASGLATCRASGGNLTSANVCFDYQMRRCLTVKP